MELDWMSEILGLDEEMFGPLPSGTDVEAISRTKQAILNVLAAGGLSTEQSRRWVHNKRSEPSEPLTLDEAKWLRKLATVEVETGRAQRNDEAPLWIQHSLTEVFHQDLPKLGREIRPSQMEMGKMVEEALQTGQALLIEAPTGVGKSLAYLIPALRTLEAHPASTKGIISTATRTLQKQLFGDLEKLQQELGSRVVASVVQGRAQYLCLQRIKGLLKSPSTPNPTKRDLETVLARSEDQLLVDFLPESLENWVDDINVDLTCTKSACPDSHRCLFLRERRVARNAQLIITNHNLWLADLKSRDGKISSLGFETDDEVVDVLIDAGLLGYYVFAIVDEAHALEKAAIAILSEAINTSDWMTILDDLYARWPDSGKRVFGGRTDAAKEEVGRLVDHLSGLLKESTEEIQTMLGVDHSRVIWPAVTREEDAGYSDSDLSHVLSKYRSEVSKVDRVYIEAQERAKRVSSRFHENVQACQVVFHLIEELEDPMRDLVARAASLGKRGAPQYRTVSALLEDLARVRRDLDAGASTILVVGRERHGVRVELISTTMAKRLSRLLYRQERHLSKGVMPSVPVVLTSATLTDGNNGFGYFRHKLGLKTTREVVIPDVYDIRNRSILYAPAGLAHPTRNKNNYLSGAIEELVRLLKLTRGKTLILTSAASWAATLTPELRNRLPELRMLHRKDMESGKLIDTFQTDIDSVLVAYGDSYWQGIDIRGESCSSVVLLPIPFDPPDMEHVVAKDIEIRAEGGDFFRDYLRPEALIRIRQGLGRLLRRSSDFGLLTILDSRIWDPDNRLIIDGLAQYRITKNFKDVEGHWKKYHTLTGAP